MTIEMDIRADGGDPLLTLRKYRQLAPWNLKDLVAIAGAALFSSSIKPINAAAAQLPGQRTVRFYVTRGLVTRPDGRGTSATYHYRHLLQILFIKSRQMEGANLTTISEEIGKLTGDVLERRVASAIGTGLPSP
ncbi:MAG: MerR family transcriptional regulator, partial [Proteobacteria bacterium]|nr:MerR family transcriptional regulator [Pseudomonadota bacterium]